MKKTEDAIRRPVERIVRRRIKGWKLPENTVCVSRPSIFGNPFGGDRAEAVRAYREWLMSGIEGRPCKTGHLYGALEAQAGHKIRDEVLRRLPELRGKNLACWCPLNEPCHADVLLELANRP